jgi:hypothetical protein
MLGLSPTKAPVETTASPDKDSGYFTLAFVPRPAPGADEEKAPAATAKSEGLDRALSARLASLAPRQASPQASVEPLVPAGSRERPASGSSVPKQEKARADNGFGNGGAKVDRLETMTPAQEAVETAIRAAKDDFRLVDSALDRIARFLETPAGAPLRAIYERKSAELTAIKRAVSRERASFHLLSDAMAAPGLSAASENRIKECLAGLTSVRGGLIARKSVKFHSEIPAFVALIDAPVAVAERDRAQDDVGRCLAPLNSEGTLSLLFHFNAPASRALASAMLDTPGVVVYPGK